MAYVKDFFKLDYSWALRRVYMCTIVERNFAQVIADLPAIFPLLRSLHMKAGGAFARLRSRSTPTSSGGNWNSTKDSTNASVFQARSSDLQTDRTCDFGAYATDMTLNNITAAECSEDQMPLRDGSPHGYNPWKHDSRRIRVHTSLHVQSHDMHLPVQARWDQGTVYNPG